MKAFPIITVEQYEEIIISHSPSLFVPTPRELFYHQIAFWVDIGLGDEDELRRLAEFVPEKGLTLLVPRRPDPLDLSRLMSFLVWDDGVRGWNDLEAGKIRNLVQVPDGPYIATNVEDGRACMDMKHIESLRELACEGRFSYTVFECIVHASVFPVLRHHNIIANASRHKVPKLSRRSPRICLRNGFPVLCTYKDRHASLYYGTPSCDKRVGIQSLERPKSWGGFPSCET
ncbi:MAG: hypothetical protein NUV53_02390 [Patescibacteria group bacterium]|nr:hypothetical protein [Patescibacteria group bacterium]